MKYARSGDVSIAYQVIGDGPLDAVLVPDWHSNLVWAWQLSYWRRFYERMSSFARLIVFDKRGTGILDRPRFFPDLETRIDDLRVVLDAVGSERAALVAAQEGCWMASLFAATYPDSTASLILYHPWIGRSDPRLRSPTEAEMLDMRDRWGTRELAEEILAQAASSLAADDQFRAWYADWTRLSVSPSAAYAFERMMREVDFRGHSGRVATLRSRLSLIPHRHLHSRASGAGARNRQLKALSRFPDRFQSGRFQRTCPTTADPQPSNHAASRESPLTDSNPSTPSCLLREGLAEAPPRSAMRLRLAQALREARRRCW